MITITCREALQTLGCATVGVVAPMSSLAQPASNGKRKPNVILIMTNDQE